MASMKSPGKITGDAGSISRLVQVSVGLALATVLFFVGAPVVIIPAGHAGVVDLWGYVPKTVLSSGLQLKLLFAKTQIMSLKTILINTHQDVPTTEGLIVQLEVSVLYHLKQEAVRDMYISVGPQYESVLVMPEMTSTIRSLTSRVEAKALYSADRDVLSSGLVKTLNEKLNPRGIVVEEALLRKVVLPKLVTAAIEEKLKAEQDSQRMEFILMKEKQEAERKRIEATGISDFQNIVSKGISEQLLVWKGIEATERLAQSRNTKVVVVGNSRNGLPLILGDGNQHTAAAGGIEVAGGAAGGAADA